MVRILHSFLITKCIGSMRTFMTYCTCLAFR